MKGLTGITHTATGTMHVNGHVRGYISGLVDVDMKGVLRGQFNAAISTGTTVDMMEEAVSLPETIEGEATEKGGAELENETV